jgi:hypothetical protein
MFGRLPSYGLYCRHVRGVRLHNLEFGTVSTEQRPAVTCDDVSAAEIVGLRVPDRGTGSPVVDLRNSKDVWIRDGCAPARSPSFLHVTGPTSSNLLVSGCDLRGVEHPVSTSNGVPHGAISLANNIVAGA